MVIKDTIWLFGKPRSYDYTTIIAISTRWVQLHGSIDVIKPRHVESYSCRHVATIMFQTKGKVVENAS
jgi:hypothetical protein